LFILPLQYTVYLTIGDKLYTNKYVSMNKSEKLTAALAKAISSGGSVFDTAEIAYMLDEQVTPKLTNFLAGCVNKGTLLRVSKGIFTSTITPPELSMVLFNVAKKLRVGFFNYISLESQLSHTGDISQITMDRLTVMTKGRKATFNTPYGTIEFIHTKKSLKQLEGDVYFDFTIKMFRASTKQAISDLNACRRNTHMLENN
jgi:hypothetical protein